MPGRFVAAQRTKAGALEARPGPLVVVSARDGWRERSGKADSRGWVAGSGRTYDEAVWLPLRLLPADVLGEEVDPAIKALLVIHLPEAGRTFERIGALWRILADFVDRGRSAAERDLKAAGLEREAATILQGIPDEPNAALAHLAARRPGCSATSARTRGTFRRSPTGARSLASERPTLPRSGIGVVTRLTR